MGRGTSNVPGLSPSKATQHANAAVDAALANAQKSGAFNGKDGGHYIPSVDDEGNLHWTASDANMPEVDSSNIKGPKGEKGDTGAGGQSAYEGAKAAGYTGTEAEFYAALISISDKAPAYTSGTDDLVAGSSELATGRLHFVYE